MMKHWYTLERFAQECAEWHRYRKGPCYPARRRMLRRMASRHSRDALRRHWHTVQAVCDCVEGLGAVT